MRAFKFRVYDEKKNCWVEDYIQYYPMDTFVKQGHTIQQFTGMLDKNLIEIYEGDLVKAKNGIVYTCKYSNEEAFKEEGVDWINWYLYEKESISGEILKAFDKEGNEICFDIPSLYDTIKEYLK